MTDHASEITAIMSPAMQSIMLGQGDAATIIPPAAAQVNDLFK